MKKYRLARIYNAGGKLTFKNKSGKRVPARWFVYFYYLNPETNKFQRFKEYKTDNGDLNRIKDLTERKLESELLKDGINEWLISGGSPFELPATEPEPVAPFDTTIKGALEFAYNEKKKKYRKKTALSNSSILNNFLEYCKLNNVPDNISLLKKIHIKGYKSWLQDKKLKNVTINTRLIVIGGLISELLEHDEENILVKDNVVKKVKRDPNDVDGYLDFQPHELNALHNYLIENNPTFWLYLQLTLYCGLRPESETGAIYKSLFLLEEKLIYIPKNISKNKKKRYPEIPHFLVSKFKDYLKEAEPNDFVFTLQDVWIMQYKPEQKALKILLPGYAKIPQLVLDDIGRRLKIYSLDGYKIEHLVERPPYVRGEKSIKLRVLMPGKKKIHKNYENREFKKVREKLGLNPELKAYGLKHTGAIMMVAAGVDLVKIMHQFGHSNTNQVLTYVKRYNANKGMFDKLNGWEDPEKPLIKRIEEKSVA